MLFEGDLVNLLDDQVVAPTFEEGHIELTSTFKSYK